MTQRQAFTAFAVCVLSASSAAAQTTIGGLSGSHTDIPRWCGKPYQSGSPNYDPGGMLMPPAPSPTPMLYVQIEPRYSIYDSSETSGEFLVDASLSYIHGEPYRNATPSDDGGMLDFDIRIEDTDKLLVSDSVVVNSTDNQFSFDFGELQPRLTPYSIVLYGAPPSSYANQSYMATTELWYLPAKNNGSTVKVDNLNGGLSVANNATNYTFTPILPFGFYTSCSGYLNYSLANVTAYKDLGFNAINPVCAFADGNLDYLFDWMDATNLWYQYDMRGTFSNGLNVTQLTEQIPLVKDRSNLLSWYTADEPDGWQYALNQTRIAYDILKQQDPYHPTALVLNCDNYYFEEYSSGADYIMEDAYPIGINPTYSQPWNTTCNETYGDCGCDDCIGELQDVSNRLDDLFDYQLWLGQPEKPLWAVLQAFSGEGYWSRDPTPEETWAMMVLSFNHGAKGIMSWTYPTSESLGEAHGAMAKIATVSPVSTFLIGVPEATRITVPGHELLDVAYWVLNKQILVGVVNLDYVSQNSTIEILLPVSVTGMASQPWGSVGWVVTNGTLTAHELTGLATSFVVLDL
ncbi:hypothetical protein B0A55_04226 [Friedmanniomyces simplex]|uniref:Glycoside hydrolase subgroup catalytic core protein n=1 Tax=Friedmanniomyces simplex TaxID=329884 RepID=A0A4U0XPP9_9PEZI|nr:hypothetical protein B0A55_04226 [Friedmanniomyces simplex]